MRVPREEQGKGAGRKRNPADFRRSGLEKAHVPLVIKWAVEGEARCGGVEQPFLAFHHHLHIAEALIVFVEAAGKRARSQCGNADETVRQRMRAIREVRKGTGTAGRVVFEPAHRFFPCRAETVTPPVADMIDEHHEILYKEKGYGEEGLFGEGPFQPTLSIDGRRGGAKAPRASSRRKRHATF